MSTFRVVNTIFSAFKGTKEDESFVRPEDMHHRHLCQLGRFFGISDLTFDNSGSCIVSVKSAVVKMQMLKTGKLLLTALVDLLPVVPTQILLESLLLTNSRLRARGLSLALEPGSRMIILQGEVPPENNYAAYKRRVELIISVAQELKQNLEPLEFVTDESAICAEMLVKA
ncbi:MAG: CesT family type III secretion system chaperone [Desulfovibrionales bacterium]|nr:CesT family type III secretion system chaperone [Desulfovibrionales bacterium]